MSDRWILGRLGFSHFWLGGCAVAISEMWDSGVVL